MIIKYQFISRIHKYFILAEKIMAYDFQIMTRENQNYRTRGCNKKTDQKLFKGCIL